MYCTDMFKNMVITNKFVLLSQKRKTEVSSNRNTQNGLFNLPNFEILTYLVWKFLDVELDEIDLLE